MTTLDDFVMVVPAIINRVEAVMSNNGSKYSRWVEEKKKAVANRLTTLEDLICVTC